MLVKSNCRAPFLGLPEGNCDFLKGITLFRYSPFTFICDNYKSLVVDAAGVGSILCISS